MFANTKESLLIGTNTMIDTPMSSYLRISISEQESEFFNSVDEVSFIKFEPNKIIKSDDNQIHRFWE